MTQLNCIRKGVNGLPNIKSSVRSVKSDALRHAKNAAEKSRVKAAGKKVVAAVKDGNAAEAKKMLGLAVKTIDKASANHVLHKNNAARKKSRLALLVNSLS